jgi:hypothetical protein
MSPEEVRASKERANIKRRVRRLWSGDSTVEEICEEVGLSSEEFALLREEMKLSERKGFYCPDQETIRLECAKFRAGWTQAEREARLEGARCVRINKATQGDNYA